MMQGPRNRQVLTVRVRGNPAVLEAQLTPLIHHFVPGLALQQFQTLALRRDSNIAQQRMLALLSSIFGILALVLSAVGLYGLVAYSVARRTREIGIRVSVGATPYAVLGMFLREHLGLVLIGTVAGSALALSVGRLTRSLLYGVPATDMISLYIAGVVLMLVAATATLIPASRAAQVDPAETLRSE